MAMQAIEMGLDECIAPDGREWCDSIYNRPDVNKEIWGDHDDCGSFQENKISLDGRNREGYCNESGAVNIKQDDEDDMENEVAYYIIKNMIDRIEKEGLSLSYITDIELKSLNYILEELEFSEGSMESQSASEAAPAPRFDDLDDDIPF